MTQTANLDLESNVGFLVSDAHRLITAAVDKSMQPLGLTRSQLRVLMHLMRGDGVTQVDIAEHLDLGKVAVGGLIDRLEEKGLVERRNHPTDRRAKNIFLTKNVDSLLQPMQSLGESLMTSLLTNISEQEYEQLTQLLKTIKTNCQHILTES